MGMIQFPGGEVMSPEPTALNRLARQPDGEGETYQPLDTPLAAVLTAAPLPEVSDDSAAAAPTTSQAEEVPEMSAAERAEQLQSFSNMPPLFLLGDDGARVLVSRQSPTADASTGSVAPASTSVSAAVRALALYGRQQGEEGSSPVLAARDGKEGAGKEKTPAVDFSRLVSQSPVQGSQQHALRDRMIASLQPLLAEVAAEAGSPPADSRNLQVNPLAAPITKAVDYQWAPARLGDNQSQWGQQLVDVLKEKVELQVNQQIKQAHIRLDPPELGRLELTVRIDGDRLNVQLNVTNPAVRDALIQSMEKLRMSLSPHHAGGVEVNVGQGGGQQPQDRWQQEQILTGRRQWQPASGEDEGSSPDWLNTLV